MAVTTTYLPSGFCASSLRIASRRTFAFHGPYSSISSSRRPSSRATSTIGRGVTERAISRSDGNAFVLVTGALGSWAGLAEAETRCVGSLGLGDGGPHQVGE